MSFSETQLNIRNWCFSMYTSVEMNTEKYTSHVHKVAKGRQICESAFCKTQQKYLSNWPCKIL